MRQFKLNLSEKPKLSLALGLISIVLIIGMALNLFIFAWSVNPDHLQGDQWRWMREVILPYREGKIGLFEALTFEFAVLSHTHILTLGEMILNERIFGLDQHVSTIIGTLSLFGCLFLFWRHLHRDRQLSPNAGPTSTITPPQNQSTIWYWGTLCVATAAFFAVGPYASFTWTLVTFENLYLLMALTLIFNFPRLFIAKRGPVLIGLMAFTFLLGDAMGTAAILATIVMACLLTVEDRSYWKLAALYVGSFILIVLIAKVTLTGRVAHSSASSVEALIYAVTHPAKTLDFIFTGLGRGVISSPNGVKLLGINVRDLTAPLGMIIALSGTGLALFALYKKRLRRNAVPLLLMGFTLISIIGAIRLRISVVDSGYMFGDRYYRFLVPFFLGTVLLAYDAWRNRPAKIFTAAFFTGAVLYVTFGLLIANFNWTKVKPSIDSHFASWDETLINYAETGDQTYAEKNRRCRNDYCKDSIAYLKARELSTFRDSESPGERD